MIVLVVDQQFFSELIHQGQTRILKNMNSTHNLVDDDALNQLILMDEDDQHEFSKDILSDYFTQLDTNIPKLEEHVARNDFASAGKLAHFLKGSAAGVGAAAIRDMCDVMQHYDTTGQDPKALFDDMLPKFKDVVEPTRQALFSRVGGGGT